MSAGAHAIPGVLTMLAAMIYKTELNEEPNPRMKPKCRWRSLSAAGLLVFSMIEASCAARDTGPRKPDGSSWDGVFQTHGALHAMHHEQQIGEVVNLSSLLPNPDLYALGAIAELAGEITVIEGVAYLSYPVEPEEARTEAISDGSVGATLLVAAEVEHWQTVRTTRTFSSDDLDRAIADLAASAGIPSGRRFPFLIEGNVEDLRWHVIDGSRVEGGGSLHQDHLAASVRKSVERTRATLVGFFSESDQGVFTHMGSKTHVHCVTHEPLSSGHVDHVVIPAGTAVKLPVP